MDTNGKTSAEPAETTDRERQTAEGAAAPTAGLEAQLDAALAEKAQLQELVLRRQADYENFRRRVEREKQDIRDTASVDAVAALLPILDDFERAIQAVPADEPDAALRQYAEGTGLIHQRLMDSLMKLGLEPVAAVGQPFDPNVHEGVQREPRNDVADQTIVEEYQRGYLFKGRLLRAAMVKVAVKP